MKTKQDASLAVRAKSAGVRWDDTERCWSGEIACAWEGGTSMKFFLSGKALVAYLDHLELRVDDREVAA